VAPSPRLRARTDVDLTVRRLGVGDYLVEGQFAIERKTLRDLATSVIDGRWFRQAAALAAGPRNGIIIPEGNGADAARIPVPREALPGALITASVFYRRPVLRAPATAETAALLV
jgi:DNA excision repair protein ERCC-4